MLNHVRKHKENFTDLNSERKTEKKMKCLTQTLTLTFHRYWLLLSSGGFVLDPLLISKTLKY